MFRLTLSGLKNSNDTEGEPDVFFNDLKIYNQPVITRISCAFKQTDLRRRLHITTCTFDFLDKIADALSIQRQRISQGRSRHGGTISENRRLIADINRFTRCQSPFSPAGSHENSRSEGSKGPSRQEPIALVSWPWLLGGNYDSLSGKHDFSAQ
eukprot:763867-Hanusia_phi.AAC.3